MFLEFQLHSFLKNCLFLVSFFFNLKSLETQQQQKKLELGREEWKFISLVFGATLDILRLLIRKLGFRGYFQRRFHNYNFLASFLGTGNRASKIENFSWFFILCWSSPLQCSVSFLQLNIMWSKFFSAPTSVSDFVWCRRAIGSDLYPTWISSRKFTVHLLMNVKALGSLLEL